MPASPSDTSSTRPLHVAFISENVLGHRSYLPRFARELTDRPELGLRVTALDALPVAPELRGYERRIRILRRFDLDFFNQRYRLAASRHVRNLVEELHARDPLDAIVINTQSIALGLADWARRMPVLIGTDGTFRQGAATPFFQLTPQARWFQWLTLRRLYRLERELYRTAALLLPWCRWVEDDLRASYGVPAERIHRLPASLARPPAGPPRPSGARKQILFVGGAYARKGGPELVEAWRRHLRDEADLHLVTLGPVEPEPGLHFHFDLKADSPEWLQRWWEADVFVLPSHLESFGIVFLEALAFGVPAVATRVGAAPEILEGVGWLVDDARPETLAAAIRDVFRDPAGTAARVAAGRSRFEQDYELSRNTALLARLVRDARARFRPDR